MKLQSSVDHLSIDDIRAEWQRLVGIAPPPDLGRDLLVRGIEWHRQAAGQRQAVRTMTRELERCAVQLENGSLALERAAAIKPGTRLVREWQGKTYVVAVTTDGYLMGGVSYPSLTKVAVAITGTNWSGPRFFGLGARTSRTRRREAA